MDIILYFELVNSGNLIRTCYSETRHDYLIIKLAIVYRYENLPLERNKIIPLPFFSLAGKKRANLPLCACEKTRVSCYKLCDENKSIKLQMLALKK